MAKVRRAGFGTVFQVENETVGIGTTANSNTVQVSGNIKSSNANVIGIATLPTYKGFLDKQTRLSDNEVDLDNLVGYVDGQPYYGDFHVHNRSNGTVVNMVGSAHTTLSHQVINDAANLKVDTLSGDIIIDGEFTVSSGTTYCTSVDQLTATSNFTVPTGTTDDRIHCHTAGSMRFNEDFGTLEFYTGEQWRTVNSFKDTGNRGRGINAANRTPAINGNEIQFINIQSLGNSISFGKLTESYDGSGCSSEIRGIFLLGHVSPTNSNIIEYITIPSEGDSIDFGDSTTARTNSNSGSNSTRGLFLGGQTPSNSDVIDYIEIGTLGDALDFGDLSQSKREGAVVTSPIRLVHIGGYDGSSNNTKDMQSVTISSKGNGINFGDTNHHSGNNTGFSNGVRGVFGGGNNLNGDFIKLIDYVTIASDGNSTEFGNLTLARGQIASTSDKTRGVFMGGRTPTTQNLIDFVTIASTGNAQDFGDLTQPSRDAIGCSDSHGGLGGY